MAESKKIWNNPADELFFETEAILIFNIGSTIGVDWKRNQFNGLNV